MLLRATMLFLLRLGPIFTHPKHGPAEFAILDLDVKRAPGALGAVPDPRRWVRDGFAAHVAVAASARASICQEHRAFEMET